MTGFYGQDYDDADHPVCDDGVVTLSSVSPDRVSWLWPGRLPHGKLVVLDGDPGVGKSTLVIDWIARLTTGTPWPDGSPSPESDALIMSAEDGAADTIRPRLDAAGGDPHRVHLWTEVSYEAPDDTGQSRRRTRPPVLPGDIQGLEDRIRAYKIRLVMVDVFMAYLAGGIKSNSDQDIRRVLHQLAAVAERTGCCIILLRHLNKSSGGNAIYRGGGSIGIVGAARAAFLAAKDPGDESGKTRVLACVKLNIAVEPVSLAYTLQDSPLHGCASVRWTGTTARNANELLIPDDELDAVNEAVGWLQGYLMSKGGEAESKDVKRAAQRDRISERTLHRARTEANVTVSNRGFPRKTMWSILPEDPAKVFQSPVVPTSEDGTTGGTVVPFPQVGPSGASRATSSGANGAGTTDKDEQTGQNTWPDGSVGRDENEHEE